MIGALEVDLVGDGKAIDIFLAILGPALIAGAAVTAALVARKTTNERQEEQLRHDTDRQREQLAHDTERQERQLQHDREIRDRDYLFNTVSVAFEHMEEATRAVIKTAGAIGSLEEARNRLTDTVSDRPIHGYLTERVASDEAEVLAALNQAHPVTMDLWGDTGRLQLLLDPQHSVVRCQAEMASKVRGWYDSVKVGYYRGNRTKEQMNHSENYAEEARQAITRFEDSCRQAFGWGTPVT